MVYCICAAIRLHIRVRSYIMVTTQTQELLLQAKRWETLVELTQSIQNMYTKAATTEGHQRSELLAEIQCAETVLACKLKYKE